VLSAPPAAEPIDIWVELNLLALPKPRLWGELTSFEGTARNAVPGLVESFAASKVSWRVRIAGLTLGLEALTQSAHDFLLTS